MPTSSACVTVKWAAMDPPMDAPTTVTGPSLLDDKLDTNEHQICTIWNKRVVATSPNFVLIPHPTQKLVQLFGKAVGVHCTRGSIRSTYRRFMHLSYALKRPRLTNRLISWRRTSSPEIICDHACGVCSKGIQKSRSKTMVQVTHRVSMDAHNR